MLLEICIQVKCLGHVRQFLFYFLFCGKFFSWTRKIFYFLAFEAYYVIFSLVIIFSFRKSLFIQVLTYKTGEIAIFTDH